MNNMSVVRIMQNKVEALEKRKRHAAVRSLEYYTERVKLEEEFCEKIRDQQTPLAELERMIDKCPNIIIYSITGDLEYSPLSDAFLHERSYEIIEHMVRRNPVVLLAADADENLPLHDLVNSCHNATFCKKRHTLTDNEQSIYEEKLLMIKLLIDTYPLSVQLQNKFGKTPLHFMCQHCLPFPMIEYLIKCHPLSLQVKDVWGNAPLHVACMFDNDLLVIQLLHTAYNLTVRGTNDEGDTPLATACCYGSLEVIEYLAYECWPIACPLLYIEKTMSEAKIEKCLEDATRETVAALIDVAFHVKNIFPDTVTAHITESVMSLDDRSKTIKSQTKQSPGQHCELVLLDTLDCHVNLDCSTVLTILESEEIQCLLKPESGHDELQELIDTVIRMNRGGRAYFAKDPGNKRQGMKVLQSTVTRLDGLFYHMRENPQICKQ